MKVQRVWSLCFVLGLLSVFSCKNNKHNTQVSTDKKFRILLHFSPGAKYYYTIRTETETSVLLNNKKLETSNQSEMGLVYEVMNTKSDSIFVKITYDQLHINVKNKNGEQDLNTSNAAQSLNPLEKALGAIKGASMNMVLSTQGDVLHITGAKEIADKLLTGLNTQDAYVKEMMQQQIGKLIGDDFIKNNLAHEFKLFPDTAVYVGDSWSRKNVESGIMQFDAPTTYRFTAVKGNTAEVETESEISNNNTTIVMGIQTVAKMEGKQGGYFETDTQTGLLMNGKSQASLEGTMQVMGRDVPVKIKISKVITAKKINYPG